MALEGARITMASELPEAPINTDAFKQCLGGTTVPELCEDVRRRIAEHTFRAQEITYILGFLGNHGDFSDDFVQVERKAFLGILAVRRNMGEPSNHLRVAHVIDHRWGNWVLLRSKLGFDNLVARIIRTSMESHQYDENIDFMWIYTQGTNELPPAYYSEASYSGLYDWIRKHGCCGELAPTQRLETPMADIVIEDVHCLVQNA